MRLEGSCTSTNKPPDGLLCFYWYTAPRLESTLVTRCLRNPERPSLNVTPHWDPAAVVQITFRFNVYGACPYWGWRSIVQPCKSVFLCGNLLRLRIYWTDYCGDMSEPRPGFVVPNARSVIAHHGDLGGRRCQPADWFTVHISKRSWRNFESRKM